MRPEAGRRSKSYSTLTASIPRGGAFSPISLLMPLTPPQPSFQKGQKHRHHPVLRDDPPGHRRQETGGLEASLALIAQALPAELGYLVKIGLFPRRPTLGQCPWSGGPEKRQACRDGPLLRLRQEEVQDGSRGGLKGNQPTEPWPHATRQNPPVPGKVSSWEAPAQSISSWSDPIWKPPVSDSGGTRLADDVYGPMNKRR